MSLRCHQYELPFLKPLTTSNATHTSRKGLILEYTDSRGCFYGETAPLDSFAGNTLAEVIEEFKTHQQAFTEALESQEPATALTDITAEANLSAPLMFGLDTLAYRIQSDEAGKSLPEYLFPGTYTPAIPVNALGNLLTDDYLQQSGQLIGNGYKTIKYKIGTDFKSELERLQQIRNKFPKLTIRLDANQAWSLQQAISYTAALEPLGIEYCEEPLGENKPQNFEELRRQTSIPLAIDESVHQVDYWPNLLPFTSFIIIKPMMVGRFQRIIETKRLADTHDNRVVFTTSLESGIGRRVTAELASGIGNPQTAQGLDTGKLLAKDLNTDKEYIYDGYYHVDEISSDMSINPKQLNQLATLLT